LQVAAAPPLFQSLEAVIEFVDIVVVNFGDAAEADSARGSENGETICQTPGDPRHTG
jgi:hypothetical protein